MKKILILYENENSIIEELKLNINNEEYKILEKKIEPDIKIDFELISDIDAVFIDYSLNNFIEVAYQINTLSEKTKKIKIIIFGKNIDENDKLIILKTNVSIILDFNEDITKEFISKVLEEKLFLKIEEKTKNWFSFTISSKSCFAIEIADYISSLAKQTSLDEQDIFNLNFVLREIQENAIEHAHKFNELKSIKITSVILSDSIIIKIEDEGEGFRVKDLLDPIENSIEKNLEQRENENKRPGGFGIAMAKKIMDTVQFNEKGNVVILTKFFN